MFVSKCCALKVFSMRRRAPKNSAAAKIVILKRSSGSNANAISARHKTLLTADLSNKISGRVINVLHRRSNPLHNNVRRNRITSSRDLHSSSFSNNVRSNRAISVLRRHRSNLRKDYRRAIQMRPPDRIRDKVLDQALVRGKIRAVDAAAAVVVAVVVTAS